MEQQPAFQPRWWQFDALQHRTRFTCLIAHRGAGKTLSLVNFLFVCAMLRPNSTYAYAVLSYRQGSRNFWREMNRLCQKVGAKFKSNKNELKFEFPNGSVVYMLSLHESNMDSNRGAHLDGICIDEAQLILDRHWRKIFYPMLTNKRGWAVIMGTPADLDEHNLLYSAKLRGENRSLRNWSIRTYDVYKSRVWTPEEIEGHRIDSAQTEEEWNQEYLCLFTGKREGIIFREFDPDIHVITDDELRVFQDEDGKIYPEMYEKAVIHVGMDFNLTPMSACIGIKVEDRLIIFDEIHIEASNTHEMAEEILYRYGGRRINIYPDQTGSRAQTSSMGKSDHQILREYGFKVHLRPSNHNPRVHESIRLVNGMLSKAEVFIHERCTKVIGAFRTMTYKTGTAIVDDKNEHEHMFAAIRYLLTFTHSRSTRGSSVGVQRAAL